MGSEEALEVIISCCMPTFETLIKYSALCWNVWSFLLLQQDYFHLLRHNNGRGGGSKSPYKLPWYLWGLKSIKRRHFFFFLKTNTCRCVLSWFIFNMVHLCAGFTGCIFSPLNFFFHVVKMVFIMHRWTSLKGKFSLHLEPDRRTGVRCFSLEHAWSLSWSSDCIF